MESLKRAAELAIHDLADDPNLRLGEGRIDRLSVDVQIGQQVEIVSLRMREGRLGFSCSCGQPACAHARLALRFVSGHFSETQESTVRASRPEAERSSFLELPRVDANNGAEGELAETLEDVVTAVARAGVAADVGASVSETLERLLAVAGTPPPLGLVRWVARMQRAIETGDVTLAAHALAAATSLIEALRARTRTREALAQITTWLGATPGDDRAVERASDRTLLEVAREWLNGTERVQIERRYLIDLQSGAHYREERTRRLAGGSIGPCPRLLGVGFAEIELGASPRRTRVLQYTTTPAISSDSWQQLHGWAERDFGAIVARYRDELVRFGALCEPFALIAPMGLRSEAQLSLVDDQGRTLPLSHEDDAGVMRRFEELTSGAAPLWVAGRLIDRDDRVMLRPLSVGTMRHDRLSYERL